MATSTTISSRNTKSRKRCRTVVGLGLVAVAAVCCDAFQTPAQTGLLHQRSTLKMPTTCDMQMVASHDLQSASKKSNNKKVNNPLTSAPPRLSHEEQQELLQLTVEARRIKKLESELASRHPSKALPLVSIRSKHAGYGDDFLAYESALEEGERARETLITTNMGLVHYCVTDIVGKGKTSRLNSLSREDLIQEGAIGLARAIDRWNPAIGGKFSTYAVYWVRAAVLRCIAEKDDMLRVPEHVSTAVRKMTRGARNLGIDIDGQDLLSTAFSSSDSSWREAQAAKALAEEAGLTDKQLTEAMRIRNRRIGGGYVAFESWMQKGQDIESDVSTGFAAGDDSMRTLEVEDLKKTLGTYLRPKEMEALFWRYGLLNESTPSTAVVENQAAGTPKVNKNYLARAENELYGKKADIPVRGKWGEAMSFTEVGKKMEVSAEYTRRLCHAALKKLRQAADDGLLEPALLF